MSDSSRLVGIWPAKEKFVNFTWQVSDVCNFKCSYCNPGNYGAKHRNVDTGQYIRVLGNLIDHFLAQDYVHFKFFFSGGEPTVWPPLLEICRFIRSKVPHATLAVNTNLSRPLSWWKEHHIHFDDVVASFHIEGCNQKTYLENVEFLQYRLNYLACRILLHDGRFQEVVDFSEKLKSTLKNCVIEYAALFEELKPHSGMYHYEDEWKREFIKNHTYFHKREIDFSYLNNKSRAYCYEVYEDGRKGTLNATRLIGSGRNNFNGWKCWINDSIFIGPNGDIKLASCQLSRIIGNIHSGEIKPLNQPVICNVSACGCGTDINIPKVVPEFETFVAEKVSRG